MTANTKHRAVQKSGGSRRKRADRFKRKKQIWDTASAARTVGAEENRSPKGLHAPHPTVGVKRENKSCQNHKSGEKTNLSLLVLDLL
jgi:hypothetical protein